jgi:phosphatidylethanolamine N-methyltransferase
VPQTHSFVHTLLHTFTRSSLTRWTTFSLVAQPILFFLLAGYPTLRSAFFLIYFAFWRAAYDFGFAWILRQQSERKYVVRTLREWGWLDVDSTTGGEEGRSWARWWKRELEMKMGEGYTWESVPAEYNSWLIFRQLVDIVLLNDFVSYSLFAWANLNFPANQGTFTHICRWIFGWSLIVFNLWVKIDAHRVVKDYAWYWGDAFWLMVMQHDLVFDGVYEIAPHPMYSVGYAGYYGLSIVVGSYAVLFVSLAAHAAQFAFLLWFENPHIDRTYGGAKKPLAARLPLDLAVPASASSFDDSHRPVSSDMTTPGVTEGETETEPEIPELPEQLDSAIHIRSPSSTTSSFHHHDYRHRRRRAFSTSIHDLTHQFFRKPSVIFSRFDPFR